MHNGTSNEKPLPVKYFHKAVLDLCSLVIPDRVYTDAANAPLIKTN